MKFFLFIAVIFSNLLLAVEVGDYVCNYYDRDKDSKWCGTVERISGDKLNINVTKVNCNSGGFLGICTNFQPGTCTGNIMLENGRQYNIWVPSFCVNN